MVEVKHNWAVIMVAPITQEDAESFIYNPAFTHDFDQDDVSESSAGCIACEQQLTAATVQSVCPGEPHESAA
jgi:hypothetical protein